MCCGCWRLSRVADRRRPSAFAASTCTLPTTPALRHCVHYCTSNPSKLSTCSCCCLACMSMAARMLWMPLSETSFFRPSSLSAILYEHNSQLDILVPKVRYFSTSLRYELPGVRLACRGTRLHSAVCQRLARSAAHTCKCSGDNVVC